MYSIQSVLFLSRRYAGARNIEMSTLGRHAAGNSKLFERLTHGRVTIRTVDRVVQYLSDHWPEGLEWPADIPRPAPQGIEAL